MTAEQGGFDPALIFEALGGHNVDYVLIGGLAVQTHGHTRMTNDVDLIPGPGRENLRSLAAALQDLGARILNPGREEAEISASMLPRATLWQFATQHGDIDVMHEVPGSVPYDELKARALEIDLNGNAVSVASRDDLIRMKLARNRPIDREDVAALTDPLP